MTALEDAQQALVIATGAADAVAAASAKADLAESAVRKVVDDLLTSTPPPPPPAPLPRFRKLGQSPGATIIHRYSTARADFDREAQALLDLGGIGAPTRIDYWSAECKAPIDTLLKMGLDVIPVIGGTLSAPGHTPASFAALTTECATAFKGRIHALEAGNEPNLHGYTGATYTPLLRAFSDAARKVDSTLTRILCGVGGSEPTHPTTFYEQGYAAGWQPYYDVRNIHLYRPPDEAGDWSTWRQFFGPHSDLRWIQKLAAERGDKTPFCVTEFGVKLGTVIYPDTSRVATVNETLQRDVTGLAIDFLRKQPGFLYATYYCTLDATHPGYGAVRQDGGHRPVYDLLKAKAAQLG